MEEKKTARAQLMYARIAPRKVQIVCDMIRGKDTKLAKAYMENTPKAACELMLKLLKSACANAETNFEMDPDNLYVKEAYCGAGPILTVREPRAVCTASTSAPATSPSSWLRKTKGGGTEHGTESSSAWYACWRHQGLGQPLVRP